MEVNQLLVLGILRSQRVAIGVEDLLESLEHGHLISRALHDLPVVVVDLEKLEKVLAVHSDVEGLRADAFDVPDQRLLCCGATGWN